MILVDKYVCYFLNEDLIYQEYADFHHIYRAYASKSRTNETLVYAWYMQRPFKFNLAILTAKNLAYVGHTYWYKNQRIPT